MHYNIVADSVHKKKLCSRLSSSEMQFDIKNGLFAFLSPFGGLEATYVVHLRIIGKHTFY